MVNSILKQAFRDLRLSWFNHHLKSRPHERDWEDEEREKLREEQNLRLWKKYSEDTEEIIEGKERAISPRCMRDLKH